MRADPERSRPSEHGTPVEVFSTCPQSSAVEKMQAAVAEVLDHLERYHSELDSCEPTTHRL
jgi:hypothetical protein